MAYIKQGFVNNETVLTAEMLDHIENGIIDLENKQINLKTINGQSLFGDGNISIAGTANSNTIAIGNFPALPYAIYKNTYGYEVEDILSKKSIEFTNYYVDTESGRDTNNGLTEEAPFLTLKKALVTGSNKNMCITIINDNANLFFDDVYGNEYAVKNNIVIKAKTSANIINAVKSPEFSLIDDYENVYKMDTSSYKLATSKNVFAVIDLDEENKDDMGIYLPYTKVESVEDVSNTTGSAYFDVSNNILYVSPKKTIDTIHPLISTYGFRFSMRNTSSCLLYLENLNVISGLYLSGRASLDEEDTRTNEFIAKNCIFQHNFAADGVPVADFDICYLIDCICAYPLADCFNYHATRMSETQILNSVCVEVNCQAEEAGYYNYTFGTNRYIMNLSTAHEGINILRVNTTGRHGDGPMVADVNGCRSVCIDCHVFNNKYDFTGTNVGCYTFNESNAAHDGRATLINCYGQDSRITDSNGFYNLYSSVTLTEIKGGNLLDGKYLITQNMMIKN